MLSFVERQTNKAVWTATVREKLDMENKNKSLELADKAATKLLKQFAPRRK